MLSTLDWLVVAAYLALTLALGVVHARRGGSGIAQYFLAGRTAPWWLAGTSMAAAAFAVDAPLVVGVLVLGYGIAGNWMWWSFAAGSVLTVFFYARLWRRAGVLTDAEFIELRYSGRAAATLRVLRGLYLALPLNLIVLAWVNLAMLVVLEAALDVDPRVALLGLLAATLMYTLVSGFAGVLLTNFVHFVAAFAGALVLALVALDAVDGIDTLMRGLPAHFGSADAAVSLLPRSGASWLPSTTLLAWLAIQWWAASFPGAEPGGGGYQAQRMLATRSERDSMLATLWFTLLHYVLRPWPWIVTALCAVVLFPELAARTPGRAYAHAAVTLLPTGVKGFVLVSLAAAYMAAVSAQLNWGASYLVNDVYRRVLDRAADERRLVRASRIATLLIALLSAATTLWLFDVSIVGAWRIVIALGAGTGLVQLLRWYWWRISAWSEIAAILAALAGFTFLTGSRGGCMFVVDLLGFYGQGTCPLDPTTALGGAYLMLLTTAFTTIVWLAVTFLAPRTRTATLHAFYRRVRPGGPGWKRIAAETGLTPPGSAAIAWSNWLAGLVVVYATLFATARLLFGPRPQAAPALLAAALAAAWIARNLRRDPDRALTTDH